MFNFKPITKNGRRLADGNVRLRFAPKVPFDRVKRALTFRPLLDQLREAHEVYGAVDAVVDAVLLRTSQKARYHTHMVHAVNVAIQTPEELFVFDHLRDDVERLRVFEITNYAPSAINEELPPIFLVWDDIDTFRMHDNHNNMMRVCGSPIECRFARLDLTKPAHRDRLNWMNEAMDAQVGLLLPVEEYIHTPEASSEAQLALSSAAIRERHARPEFFMAVCEALEL